MLVLKVRFAPRILTKTWVQMSRRKSLEITKKPKKGFFRDFEEVMSVGARAVIGQYRE